MVKVTQIEDETFTNGQQTVEKVEINQFSDDDASDVSDSEFSDDDDFDYENETIYDRIAALKDIIPPLQRDQLSSLTSTVSSYVSAAANNGGKLLWALTSSSLLLGVPLALAILSETQLQEMEKDMSLQKAAQDVLAPGSDEAFNEKK
ncbi:hypothetical protein LELG_05114 [Lodderomyces elongisporus NRRL YB-4239]|uniref:Mitochondrial import receptor subunit TOM22 n=1 Tax=Lodderomyces elongisporus (strain ATCC 11503 / CBS 2605 / JCM 1781 / NBRC 1676 / NRRL YB-4239) TaxID=379508 RepID=A5E675_LODEL|nr:hypothetical protein LELG_05114 [Lodderomyces elongisporus NRRL YB-4239]